MVTLGLVSDPGLRVTILGCRDPWSQGKAWARSRRLSESLEIVLMWSLRVLRFGWERLSKEQSKAKPEMSRASRGVWDDPGASLQTNAGSCSRCPPRTPCEQIAFLGFRFITI